jgi:capsular exopolysaccharide synthesis family protein
MNKPDTVTSENGFDLNNVVGFILGNRLWLLLGLLLGAVAGLIFAMMQTPMYKANATLLFTEAKKSSSPNSQMDGLFDLNKSSSIDQAVPVLTSRSIAEDVVKQLALNAHLENISDLSAFKTFQRGVRNVIHPPDSLSYEGVVGKARYYLASMVGNPGPVGSMVLRNLEFDPSVSGYRLFLKLLPDSSGLSVFDAAQKKMGQCEVGKLCRVDFPNGHVSFVAEKINAGYGTTLVMSFRSLEAAASMVRNSIEVNVRSKGAKYLSLDATWPDPNQGALILKVLSDVYAVRDSQAVTRSDDQMIDFLDKNLVPTQMALEQAERKLRAFLEERKMFDMKLQYAEGADNITKFDQQRIDAALESQKLAYVANLLGKSNDESSGALISSVDKVLADQWQQLQEKSVQLELEDKFLEGFTDEYPAKKEHLLALKSLEKRKKDLKKQAMQAIRDNQDLLVAKSKSLELASVQVQQGLGLDAETQIRFMQLQRNKEIAEKLYGMMQSKREEMRIAKAGEISSMQVLDSALPGVQISPDTRRSTTLGAIFGLLLVGSILFVREKLDIAIKDPGEIERLTGLYVHGLIPLHKEATDNESLVTVARPTSVEAEAYRSLRTSIQLASLENQVTSIMITSSGPGEGKSTTMSNLAVTLAQAGKKTLIVDCDMRRPTVNKLFKIERDPGLSEVLTDQLDWRDFIHSTMTEGLFVLPSGKVPSNPSELVGRTYMATILAEMKQEYDFVLCDVPPILVVSDAALLASQLDGVLILVRSGVAVAHEVARAREQMERVGGRVLGAIFNAYDTSSAGYGYSRYGYSRYGYSRYGYASKGYHHYGEDQSDITKPQADGIAGYFQLGYAALKEFFVKSNRL